MQHLSTSSHAESTNILTVHCLVHSTDLYKYSPDAVPPIHTVSYHVATDKPPAQDGDKFRSIFSDNLQPIAIRGKKHVTRYWSINTAATAVPLSVHPSLLAITTKLAAAILGVGLLGRGVLPAQYCPCGPPCVHVPCTVPLHIQWPGVWLSKQQPNTNSCQYCTNSATFGRLALDPPTE